MNTPSPLPSPRISASRRNLLLVSIAVIVVALLALSSARLLLDTANGSDEARPESQPGAQLPMVELNSSDGRAVTSEVFRGRPSLVYFGYTHCPDFCPLTLASFSEIKAQLGAQSDAVQFVFISLDGSRDTPEVIDAYLARFDEEIIGLTGPEETVRMLGAPLGVWFQRAPSDGALEYTVDHTTDTYLIAADGTALRSFPFDTPASEIAAELQAELSGE